jgi:nicotinate-nucleotide adenylyltransferase
MKRIAFYGGSFDPVHLGHLAIARSVLDEFMIDQFVFIPASHAPHKLRKKPTSTYDRYAMLCLATNDQRDIVVSRMEIEMPDRPFSVETLTRLSEEFPSDQLFFVMGADSWMDITTWREWETVLALTNHIVVTRPGIAIGTDHVTDEIRGRIIDLRGGRMAPPDAGSADKSIYITDKVNYDISATDIRQSIRENGDAWRGDVADEVANYIEKYQIYN